MNLCFSMDSYHDDVMDISGKKDNNSLFSLWKAIIPKFAFTSNTLFSTETDFEKQHLKKNESKINEELDQCIDIDRTLLSQNSIQMRSVSPKNIYIDPSILRDILRLDDELKSILDDLNLTHDDDSSRNIQLISPKENIELVAPRRSESFCLQMHSKSSNNISLQIFKRENVKSLTILRRKAEEELMKEEEISSSPKKKNLIIKCGFLEHSPSGSMFHVFRQDSFNRNTHHLRQNMPAKEKRDEPEIQKRRDEELKKERNKKIRRNEERYRNELEEPKKERMKKEEGSKRGEIQCCSKKNNRRELGKLKMLIQSFSRRDVQHLDSTKSNCSTKSEPCRSRNSSSCLKYDRENRHNNRSDDSIRHIDRQRSIKIIPREEYEEKRKPKLRSYEYLCEEDSNESTNNISRRREEQKNKPYKTIRSREADRDHLPHETNVDERRQKSIRGHYIDREEPYRSRKHVTFKEEDEKHHRKIRRKNHSTYKLNDEVRRREIRSGSPPYKNYDRGRKIIPIQDDFIHKKKAHRSVYEKYADESDESVCDRIERKKESERNERKCSKRCVTIQEPCKNDMEVQCESNRNQKLRFQETSKCGSPACTKTIFSKKKQNYVIEAPPCMMSSCQTSSSSHSQASDNSDEDRLPCFEISQEQQTPCEREKSVGCEYPSGLVPLFSPSPLPNETFRTNEIVEPPKPSQVDGSPRWDRRVELQIPPQIGESQRPIYGMPKDSETKISIPKTPPSVKSRFSRFMSSLGSGGLQLRLISASDKEKIKKEAEQKLSREAGDNTMDIPSTADKMEMKSKFIEPSPCVPFYLFDSGVSPINPPSSPLPSTPPPFHQPSPKIPTCGLFSHDLDIQSTSPNKLPIPQCKPLYSMPITSRPSQSELQSSCPCRSNSKYSDSSRLQSNFLDRESRTRLPDSKSRPSSPSSRRSPSPDSKGLVSTSILPCSPATCDDRQFEQFSCKPEPCEYSSSLHRLVHMSPCGSKPYSSCSCRLSGHLKKSLRTSITDKLGLCPCENSTTCPIQSSSAVASPFQSSIPITCGVDARSSAPIRKELELTEHCPSGALSSENPGRSKPSTRTHRHEPYDTSLGFAPRSSQPPREIYPKFHKTPSPREPTRRFSSDRSSYRPEPCLSGPRFYDPSNRSAHISNRKTISCDSGCKVSKWDCCATRRPRHRESHKKHLRMDICEPDSRGFCPTRSKNPIHGPSYDYSSSVSTSLSECSCDLPISKSECSSQSSLGSEPFMCSKYPQDGAVLRKRAKPWWISDSRQCSRYQTASSSGRFGRTKKYRSRHYIGKRSPTISCSSEKYSRQGFDCSSEDLCYKRRCFPPPKPISRVGPRIPRSYTPPLYKSMSCNVGSCPAQSPSACSRLPRPYSSQSAPSCSPPLHRFPQPIPPTFPKRIACTRSSPFQPIPYPSSYPSAHANPYDSYRAIPNYPIRRPPTQAIPISPTPQQLRCPPSPRAIPQQRCYPPSPQAIPHLPPQQFRWSPPQPIPHLPHQPIHCSPPPQRIPHSPPQPMLWPPPQSFACPSPQPYPFSPRPYSLPYPQPYPFFSASHPSNFQTVSPRVSVQLIPKCKRPPSSGLIPQKFPSLLKSLRKPKCSRSSSCSSRKPAWGGKFKGSEKVRWKDTTGPTPLGISRQQEFCDSPTTSCGIIGCPSDPRPSFSNPPINYPVYPSSPSYWPRCYSNPYVPSNMQCTASYRVSCESGFPGYTDSRSSSGSSTSSCTSADLTSGSSSTSCTSCSSLSSTSSGMSSPRYCVANYSNSQDNIPRVGCSIWNCPQPQGMSEEDIMYKEDEHYRRKDRMDTDKRYTRGRRFEKDRKYEEERNYFNEKSYSNNVNVREETHPNYRSMFPPPQPFSRNLLPSKMASNSPRSKVCSSVTNMQFDSTLRFEGICHYDNRIQFELQKIGIDQLIEASKPAKCCRQTVINQPPREELPYTASLASLPLDRADIRVIRQSVHMATKKSGWGKSKKKRTEPSNKPIDDRKKLVHYANLVRDDFYSKKPESEPNYEVRFFFHRVDSPIGKTADRKYCNGSLSNFNKTKKNHKYDGEYSVDLKKLSTNRNRKGNYLDYFIHLSIESESDDNIFQEFQVNLLQIQTFQRGHSWVKGGRTLDDFRKENISVSYFDDFSTENNSFQSKISYPDPLRNEDNVAREMNENEAISIPVNFYFIEQNCNYQKENQFHQICRSISGIVDHIFTKASKVFGIKDNGIKTDRKNQLLHGRKNSVEICKSKIILKDESGESAMKSAEKLCQRRSRSFTLCKDSSRVGRQKHINRNVKEKHVEMSFRLPNKVYNSEGKIIAKFFDSKGNLLDGIYDSNGNLLTPKTTEAILLATTIFNDSGTFLPGRFKCNGIQLKAVYDSEKNILTKVYDSEMLLQNIVFPNTNCLKHPVGMFDEKGYPIDQLYTSDGKILTSIYDIKGELVRGSFLANVSQLIPRIFNKNGQFIAGRYNRNGEMIEKVFNRRGVNIKQLYNADKKVYRKSRYLLRILDQNGQIIQRFFKRNRIPLNEIYDFSGNFLCRTSTRISTDLLSRLFDLDGFFISCRLDEHHQHIDAIFDKYNHKILKIYGENMNVTKKPRSIYNQKGKLLSKFYDENGVFIEAIHDRIGIKLSSCKSGKALMLVGRLFDSGGHFIQGRYDSRKQVIKNVFDKDGDKVCKIFDARGKLMTRIPQPNKFRTTEGKLLNMIFTSEGIILENVYDVYGKIKGEKRSDKNVELIPYLFDMEGKFINSFYDSRMHLLDYLFDSDKNIINRVYSADDLDWEHKLINGKHKFVKTIHLKLDYADNNLIKNRSNHNFFPNVSKPVERYSKGTAKYCKIPFKLDKSNDDIDKKRMDSTEYRCRIRNWRGDIKSEGREKTAKSFQNENCNRKAISTKNSKKFGHVKRDRKDSSRSSKSTPSTTPKKNERGNRNCGSKSHFRKPKAVSTVLNCFNANENTIERRRDSLEDLLSQYIERDKNFPGKAKNDDSGNGSYIENRIINKEDNYGSISDVSAHPSKDAFLCNLPNAPPFILRMDKVGHADQKEISYNSNESYKPTTQCQNDYHDLVPIMKNNSRFDNANSFYDRNYPSWPDRQFQVFIQESMMKKNQLRNFKEYSTSSPVVCLAGLTGVSDNPFGRDEAQSEGISNTDSLFEQNSNHFQSKIPRMLHPGRFKLHSKMKNVQLPSKSKCSANRAASTCAQCPSEKLDFNINPYLKVSVSTTCPSFTKISIPSCPSKIAGKQESTNKSVMQATTSKGDCAAKIKSGPGCYCDNPVVESTPCPVRIKEDFEYFEEELEEKVEKEDDNEANCYCPPGEQPLLMKKSDIECDCANRRRCEIDKLIDPPNSKPDVFWALTKVSLRKDGTKNFEILDVSPVPPGYYLMPEVDHLVLIGPQPKPAKATPSKNCCCK